MPNLAFERASAKGPISMFTTTKKLSSRVTSFYFPLPLPPKKQLSIVWFALRDDSPYTKLRWLQHMWSATKHRSDLLHHKPNNTHSQLNRWIRCHSAERCQTFYNEGWWQFADWQAVSSDVKNTTSDKITTVKWSLDLSSKANEVRAFGNVYPCTFPASYGLNYIKVCVWLATGILSAKGQLTAF